MKKVIYLLLLESQSICFFLLSHLPGFYIANKIRSYFISKCFLYCGKHFWLNRDFQIEEPKKIEIGNNVGINIRSFISGGGGVSIGDNVLIGPNVSIFSANHNYKAPNIPINKQGHTLKKVIIKNNVWIGSNSIILPGVTIHENVVIGAGSVVSKDCESNSLYAGNPAKLIKKLY